MNHVTCDKCDAPIDTSNILHERVAYNCTFYDLCPACITGFIQFMKTKVQR